MARRAPPGSRSVAEQIARLVREYGYEAVARHADVHPRTLRTLVSRSERGLSLGPVIRSAANLDTWRSRLEAARSALEPVTIRGVSQTGPRTWTVTEDAEPRDVASIADRVKYEGEDVMINDVPVLARVPAGYRPQPDSLAPNLTQAIERAADLRQAGVPGVVVVYHPETDEWEVQKPESENYEEIIESV